MTDPEFTTFAKRLFIVLPDVWVWLNEKAPDLKQTQEVWREILRPYSLTECLLVIESWIKLTRPTPKGYEFGQLAFLVANCVQFERAKERRVNGADKSRFEFAEQSRAQVLQKRRNYQPIQLDGKPLASVFREGKLLMDARDKGEITEAEFYRRKQELLATV